MIRFRVDGIPAPKGSAKAFMRPGMKFPVVIHDNPRTKPWEALVRAAADEAGCRGDYVGPVWIRIVFLLPRVKTDYAKDGSVRASAPTTHLKKPDLDKLCRALIDGLSGAAFVDDNQVVAIWAEKRYARISSGERIGAVVEIEFADPLMVGVPAKGML